ncbi:MAG TPA: hypothetical protein VM621_06695 [Luteibacter sp.]|uniref:hypothetical protein n=1 Tax=Luteibacter sp. TaxID=1886636 RepID=UPI002BA11E6C|nr:hypothetical protein [Luteibacter sp.]HVI54724.1 hypothetical protein [Luteibacter sp.]
MKCVLRLACVAALLPCPALAAKPTAVDIHHQLIRYRVAEEGVGRALDYSTREFVANFLEDPDSPYSALRGAPPIANEIWWSDFVDSLPFNAADKPAVALDMLQWQSGFTKARPGIEVAVDAAAARRYRGREVAANAIKAGVDADIFWKASDMNGAMSTVAAGHAVALQLLRELSRMKATTDDDQAHGIKPDVLARYLAQRNPQNIDENDQRYLADLLRYAISKGDFTVDTDGHRQLPAAYRVARVAAAYRDAKGYINANGYCLGNEPHPREPSGSDATEYNRPLCFVAATDRAVQSWFRRQMREEASSVRLAHQATDTASARLSFWLNTVLVLTDLAPFVEIGEAAVVDEMVGAGALAEDGAAFAEDRANQLTCRIRK